MRPECPFHLAFPVHDLDAARSFYADLLGCGLGRTSDRWIDFDFHGHQITAHLAAEECREAARNAVDGKRVPVRHFGLVLPWAQWQALAERLAERKVEFMIEPNVRFPGTRGEQGTFFVTDPSGNVLEFKSFKQPDNLFASGQGETFQ